MELKTMLSCINRARRVNILKEHDEIYLLEVRYINGYIKHEVFLDLKITENRKVNSIKILDHYFKGNT